MKLKDFFQIFMVISKYMNFSRDLCMPAADTSFEAGARSAFGQLDTWYVSHSIVTYPVKMEYGWNLWLKSSFMIRYTTIFFYWNPSMGKEGHFYYWICIFRPKSSLLWSKWKGPCAWKNFKNIFSRPLFTIIFRPKILITTKIETWKMLLFFKCVIILFS